MISWVAMDGMLERQMAIDAELHAKVIGRPLRSSAKRQTDEELLTKLRAFGLELSRSLLESLCKGSLSAQEAATPLMAKCVFKSREEELNGDWIWVCVDALWQRWFPLTPSFEMLDDKMQAGYELMQSGEGAAACRIWLEAWDDVLYFFDKAGFATISAFDARFLGTQSLFNWIQDLEMELWNAGLKERQFFIRRIALCEKALGIFDEGETWLAENCRRAQAETYFELGETDKADSLYREWLNADPQWGWGWIGWSDCYRFTHTEFKDVLRAEALLREGLEIDGVKDFEDLAERLADLCEILGRTEEADEIRQEAELRKEVVGQRAIEISTGTKSVSVRRTVDFGDEGLPLSELPRLTELLRASSASATGGKQKVGQKAGQKVGRNDPCTCGSGKKYKKCCGQ
jgi:tetratricopeptide (TPR) repeat protein